jgi:fido (protein-threonine AMPylation protein)
MSNLSITVPKAISNGWPTWHSHKDGPGSSCQFTVRLAQQLMGEINKPGFAIDPAKIIHEVCKESQRGGPSVIEDVWQQLEDSLAMVVYGSNFIESAGTSYPITIYLCREVFRGKQVRVEIDENYENFKAHVEALVQTGRRSDLADVIQSRKDVIQHAKALNYMIDRIILENSPWSEAHILEAHRILCEEMDSEEVTPGRYRTGAVRVLYEKPGDKEKGKKSKAPPCMHAKAVPKYMTAMVDQLNKDILRAEESGIIDPYTLAAHYHHQFVNIHPFWDGNGRMSRVILNILLLKYAGHVACIGCSQPEKDEYLDIVGRGAQQFYKEDMEIDFEDHTGHKETAYRVLAKSKSNLERLWSCVNGRKIPSNP